MAAFTRSQLKQLVKECIVEILAEGLGGNLTEAVVQPRTQQQPIRRVPSPPAQSRPQQRSMISEDLIKASAKATGMGDDVMMAMLTDTARNTLPNHLAAERGGALAGASTPAEMMVANSTPEQLFGEAASHWAELAFMDDPRQQV